MLIVALLLIGAALAAIIAFSRPTAPPPQTSIAAPFHAVDFSDLPPTTTFPARDATPLAYRRYPGNPDRVVVLIHGSSASSASMHAVAKALAAAGATVIVPDIRGHGRSGPLGDIAYIGQLEDDLEDLLNSIGQPHQPAEITLIGFSSGGGFALRIAGGRLAARFTRTILLAPFLRYDAPNARPAAGGWTSVAVPRLLALSFLTKIGITPFNGLPVLAFAVEAGNPNHLTTTYSYRLLTNFQPHDDYLADIRRAAKPLMVVAGADDEIFRTDQLHAALAPANPNIRIDIVPGIGHIGLITTPAGTAAITAAWQSKF
jgi:alpha-beta hydrolase superfamily lysophospholipase